MEGSNRVAFVSASGGNARRLRRKGAGSSSVVRAVRSMRMARAAKGNPAAIPETGIAVNWR